MALINFMQFRVLLSQLSKIDEKLLNSQRDKLLKALSPLGEHKEFDGQRCKDAINSIEPSVFEALGLVDDETKKEFCKCIFIIFKKHHSDFHACL